MRFQKISKCKFGVVWEILLEARSSAREIRHFFFFFFFLGGASFFSTGDDFLGWVVDRKPNPLFSKCF